MMVYARQISAWRLRWENDPAVTFKSIAAEVGCTGTTVSTYARTNGWTPAEGVAYRRRHLSAARTNEIRPVKPAAPPAVRIKPPRNTAWTSAFCLSSPVSTLHIVPAPPQHDDED